MDFSEDLIISDLPSVTQDSDLRVEIQQLAVTMVVIAKHSSTGFYSL